MSDREIDEIWDNPKNKKIKSGQKGKGAEREICKLLNARFASLLSEHTDWGTFSRTVGSGNRWGQGVSLSAQAKDTYSGDICVPPTFKWVIESKKGYNDIDLCSCFAGKCRELDEFLQQVEDDAERTGRKPLLVWKKDRKPRIAFMKQKDLFPSYSPTYCDPSHLLHAKGGVCLRYKCWVGVLFDEVLSLDENFWFEGIDTAS